MQLLRSDSTMLLVYSMQVIVHNNDIYYKENAWDTGKSPLRVTHNGVPELVFNGVPDWVYEGK